MVTKKNVQAAAPSSKAEVTRYYRDYRNPNGDKCPRWALIALKALGVFLNEEGNPGDFPFWVGRSSWPSPGYVAVDVYDKLDVDVPLLRVGDDGKVLRPQWVEATPEYVAEIKERYGKVR